jgi:putative heme iron utilization protein
MKSLSKLHQEAITQAQNETDQNKAAAMAMIEKPIEMIKAIMLKHELAVIEVMRELHESREAAVRAEREACAKLCEEYAIGLERNYSEIIADKIRARGQA